MGYGTRYSPRNRRSPLRRTPAPLSVFEAPMYYCAGEDLQQLLQQLKELKEENKMLKAHNSQELLLNEIHMLKAKVRPEFTEKAACPPTSNSADWHGRGDHDSE